MKKVFVSRPNVYDPVYSSSVQRLEKFLHERGLNPITIGSTVFPNESPLSAVKNEMKQCDGIIILGIPQIDVLQGFSKKRTKSQKLIKDKQYPSPWNQIEGAMAFMLDLPIMIIAQEGIEDGLLETGVLPVFANRFNLRSYHWIEKKEFLDPFNQWFDKL